MKIDSLNKDELSLIMLAIYECRRIYTYNAPSLPLLIQDNGRKEMKDAAEKLTKLEEKIRNSAKMAEDA